MSILLNILRRLFITAHEARSSEETDLDDEDEEDDEDDEEL